MEPTKDQKYKTFTKEQKRFLYREISKEANEDYKRVSSNLESYITNLIDTKLLTEDELFMRTRPYIVKTKRAFLNPEDLGMEKNLEYPGFPDYKASMEKSYYLDTGIPSCQDPKYSYRCISDFSIGHRIKERCSPEEINFICDALRDVALKFLKKEYFGLETGWIISGTYYNRFFPSLRTWGALYKKSPEYFEILVDHYYTEPQKEKEADEYDLLRDLIHALSK
jgi:hypothetical protein